MQVSLGFNGGNYYSVINVRFNCQRNKIPAGLVITSIFPDRPGFLRACMGGRSAVRKPWDELNVLNGVQFR